MMVWETVKIVAVVFFSFVSLVYACVLKVKARNEKRKAAEAKTEAERLERERNALELDYAADDLIQASVQDVEKAFKTANGVSQKNGVLKKRLVMSEVKSFLASNGAKVDDNALSERIDKQVDFMNTNKK